MFFHTNLQWELFCLRNNIWWEWGILEIFRFSQVFKRHLIQWVGQGQKYVRGKRPISDYFLLISNSVWRYLKTVDGEKRGKFFYLFMIWHVVHTNLCSPSGSHIMSVNDLVLYDVIFQYLLSTMILHWFSFGKNHINTILISKNM
jgi:hypothetical protein